MTSRLLLPLDPADADALALVRPSVRRKWFAGALDAKTFSVQFGQVNFQPSRSIYHQLVSWQPDATISLEFLSQSPSLIEMLTDFPYKM